MVANRAGKICKTNWGDKSTAHNLRYTDLYKPTSSKHVLVHTPGETILYVEGAYDSVLYLIMPTECVYDSLIMDHACLMVTLISTFLQSIANDMTEAWLFWVCTMVFM